MAKRRRIAFLGPTSTYTHQAALSAFPEGVDVEHVPLQTIGEVFNTVSNKEYDFGIVPFENSTNGSVVFSLDALCDRNKTLSSIRVAGVVYVRIRHCLVGNGSLDTLKEVHSHPQAFGQCEKFLKSLGSIRKHDATSTSKAVELAAADTSGTVAAIGGKAAAEKLNANIIVEGIEDWDQNITRFFVIGTEGSKYGEGLRGKEKTLLRFRVDHDKPGALCDVLQVFKRFGLNLTSITSRPSQILPWNYIFFVECLGGLADTAVRAAINEVRQEANEVVVLGSFIDSESIDGSSESS